VRPRIYEGERSNGGYEQRSFKPEFTGEAGGPGKAMELGLGKKIRGIRGSAYGGKS